MTVLNLVRLSNTLPSSIIGLTDDYEAFCFNEVCMVLMAQMDNGVSLLFSEDIDNETKKKSASSGDNKDIIKMMMTGKVAR